jgi:hypothetical protein
MGRSSYSDTYYFLTIGLSSAFSGNSDNLTPDNGRSSSLLLIGSSYFISASSYPDSSDLSSFGF